MLHPADVKGRFQIRKNVTYAILILIYVALPFIQIGGHPAMHIDIAGRNAYLFGESFTNKDFYLVFFLLTGVGFALFVVTALWGRIWCGYACPQTVFLEGVIRRFERWIEGPRERRIRRNLGPLTFDKAWRKSLKHGIFLGASFLIAHVFLAYFIPVDNLLLAMREGPSGHLTAFIWTTVMTGILYFDFAWFREQTCLIICPYGRTQSALVDDDTVIIGYDTERGEPRSKKAEEGGDCIDCKRCIAVCPTGIDIRNGLQMECIGCANCIDACDDIMARIGRPKGLIRYDSRRGFDTGKRRSLLRPRVFIYAVAGLAGLLVAGFTMSSRTEFETQVLRSRGLPYTLMDEKTKIRNVYNVRIQNKTDETRTYFVRAESDAASEALGAETIVAQQRIHLDGLEDTTVPIVVTAARASYTGPVELGFSVIDSTTGEVRRVDVRFRGP
jgi:cytochrome c oxidase accessory protein FixG